MLAIIITLGAIASVLISGGGLSQRRQLDPTNAAPNGAKALAEVLRAQGVQVRVVSTLREALAAKYADATVMWFDGGDPVAGGTASKLAAIGTRTVIVSPSSTTLDQVAAGVRNGGSIGGEPEVGCSFRPATRAGKLSDDLRGFRIDDEATKTGWSGCFAHDNRAAVAVHDDGDLVLVASPEVFQNDTITREGNAALALGLLGSTTSLVWFVPTEPTGSAPTLGELTPGWLSPLLTLGAVVVVAAGIWRGRRFGPLVFENLPVLVPAAESSTGRGRLYARNAVRVHALDQLRFGTIGRVSAMLRVPRSAGVSEVVRAIANTTGRPAPELSWVLRDFEPRTDHELMQATDRLTLLEAQVRAATGATRHPHQSSQSTQSTQPPADHAEGPTP